jgi:hypothetical protein
MGRQRGPVRNPPRPADDETPTAMARVLSRIIEHGTRVQRPTVRAYLRRLRHTNPDAGPGDIVVKLERHYLAAVIVSGAAVGSLATVPGIGTLLAFSAIAGETVAFLAATAFFVLAVAEVHHIPTDRKEQRRALVLAVLVGDAGKRAVADLLSPGRTGGAWLTGGPAGTLSRPLPAVSRWNSRLLGYFVRRFTLRRGALLFGKLLPVGLGAVVGGVGNRLIGKKIVANARKTFSVAPVRWPVALHLLPPLPAGDIDPPIPVPGRRAND